MGVCMIEQRRQARKFFDFACGGIGAAGVEEDAMAGLAVCCCCWLAHSRLTEPHFRLRNEGTEHRGRRAVLH
jgi:hypothetical protein